MGEVVNLRTARKRAARRRDEATAEANRALHGLTRNEKHRQATETARAEAALDAHRREPAEASAAPDEPSVR